MPLPLPGSLRELHIQMTVYDSSVDPSSLNWQHRLAPSTVPLLAVHTPEFRFEEQNGMRTPECVVH